MIKVFPSAILSILALVAALVGCAPQATAQAENSENAARAEKAGIPVPDEENIPEDLSVATFGAGCFWCVEELFMQKKGVVAALAGYIGGSKETANYKAICTGTTKHTEVIQVYFDPAVVSFADLVQFFWKAHDPTQLNRQGNDVGFQYRSAIFYHDADQKRIAEAGREAFNGSNKYGRPAATVIEEATTFYPAEPYHQNYYRLNPDKSYIQGVLVPKLRELGLTVIE